MHFQYTTYPFLFLSEIPFSLNLVQLSFSWFSRWFIFTFFFFPPCPQSAQFPVTHLAEQFYNFSLVIINERKQWYHIHNYAYPSSLHSCTSSTFSYFFLFGSCMISHDFPIFEFKTQEIYIKFTPTEFYSVNACNYYHSSHSQVLLLDKVKLEFDTISPFPKNDHYTFTTFRIILLPLNLPP